MLDQKEILAQIKKGVQEVVPDAQVFLFGSRARGDWHEESDWDILVLTEKKYPQSVKWQIHDNLFLLSVVLRSVFQFIVTTNEQWDNYPRYYVLQRTIQDQLQSL